MTLSSIATILIEDYLPDAQRKYLFQNFQQSPHYRSYNDNIPAYLQGRPRNTILHCLDRKGSSNKFTSEDITDIDTKEGVFSVCSSKGRIYTVNFGINSDDRMPSCTCVTGALITYLVSTSSQFFSIGVHGHGIVFLNSTWRVHT